MFFSGSSDGFCNGKADATFQSPYDNTKFFSCVEGQATLCQSCPGDLVYVEKCGQCLVHDTGRFSYRLFSPVFILAAFLDWIQSASYEI